MDKTKYMRNWWEKNPDRRKGYEQKRAAKRTPEEKEKLRKYIKEWREKNLDAVKRKDKAKYQRRKAVIAEQGKKQRLENPAHVLWKAAKSRAKKDGVEFDLSPSDVIIPQICPALGVRILVGRGVGNPNAPSIDRIRPDGGYVKGNICVISLRANAIKRDATAAELRLIADYIDAKTFADIQRYIVEETLPLAQKVLKGYDWGGS